MHQVVLYNYKKKKNRQLLKEQNVTGSSSQKNKGWKLKEQEGMQNLLETELHQHVHKVIIGIDSMLPIPTPIDKCIIERFGEAFRGEVLCGQENFSYKYDGASKGKGTLSETDDDSGYHSNRVKRRNHLINLLNTNHNR